MIAAATRLIVLDCVDNPSNVGSIARTAAALGWDGLLLDSTSADPLSRRALRVSMGTTFKLAFARFANTGDMLNNLQQHGFSTIGLTPHHHSREVADLRAIKVSGKRAVVLGSERQGLSDTSLELCSQLSTIQMAKGVDSLNVASASAIACFALL
jgi:tRNA G18 (ribose-2'-O)-methylase SpoU